MLTHSYTYSHTLDCRVEQYTVVRLFTDYWLFFPSVPLFEFQINALANHFTVGLDSKTHEFEIDKEMQSRETETDRQAGREKERERGKKEEKIDRKKIE